MDKPLWQPSPRTRQEFQPDRFHARRPRALGRLPHRNTPAAPLVRHRAGQFWQSVWSFCDVIGDGHEGPALLDGNRMPGARWFPGAKLNFAENLLRRRDRSTAIVFWGEDRLKTTVTYVELYSEVSRMAQALRAAGVNPGDRVAAYMPNVPGTVIAMLAATSLGAIWSSCSPDFGVQGVLDRFGQIEPKVLFAADGYFYNGKTIDLLPRLKEIVDAMPSVEKLVIVPYTSRALRYRAPRRSTSTPYGACGPGSCGSSASLRPPALHHVLSAPPACRVHRAAPAHVIST